MAFDPTQPYATYTNDVGNTYRQQSGTYYDLNGNVVTTLPASWPPNSAGQPVWQSFTYAQLPAASGFNGYTVFVSDWGANGTLARSNGSRWLPINGQSVVKRMGAAPSPIANSETIVAQIQLPAGSAQTNDSFIIRTGLSKSGTTDSLQFTVHIGTAGSVADAAVTGLNALAALGAAARSAGPIFGFRITGTTSVQSMGNAAGGVSPYGSVGASAPPAATTGLSDFSSNANYITVTVKSSGTTDTVGVQEVTIIHEAG